MLSVLNNIASLSAQNQLDQTSNSLQSTLSQLSSGQRINSGADDPAGLQIANQLGANIAALQQSVNNVTDGVGLAQVADGALSQVSTMLNRAVTLATEAANGMTTASQATALNSEYQAILTEINNIGTGTTYNGSTVFGTTSATTTSSVYITDASSNYSISVAVAGLSQTALSLNSTNLSTTAGATSALAAINTAINTISSNRGSIGAAVGQMQDAQNVINVQVQNITSAQNSILAANMPDVVSNLSKDLILQQSGMYALQQANSVQQGILKLLQ